MATTVTLLSKDQKSIEIPENFAKRSVMIEDLIDGLDEVNVIPLTDINADILEMIFEYCSKFFEDDLTYEKENDYDPDEEKKLKEIPKEIRNWLEEKKLWERYNSEPIKTNGNINYVIIPFILAANFLSIPDLLNVLCLYYSERIEYICGNPKPEVIGMEFDKGLRPAQRLNEYFGVTCDISQEELDKIEAEKRFLS